MRDGTKAVIDVLSDDDIWVVVFNTSGPEVQFDTMRVSSMIEARNFLADNYPEARIINVSYTNF